MEISPYKFNLPGADPKPDYVHVVSVNKKINELLEFQGHHFIAFLPFILSS